MNLYIAVVFFTGAFLACSGSVIRERKFIFECPPPREIYPCTCEIHPKKIVRCDNVESFAIVRYKMGRFSNPLPSLEITNIHTYRLPHHAFQNISTKRLKLNGNNIRRIDDDAFEGQDALGFLALSEDRLAEFPTEALKRLPGLQSLSLSGNFIMRLTDESIGESSQLRILVLSENRLSSMEQNSFPRNLESLSLSRNLLTTLNGTVKRLGNLESLYVADNRLSTVKDELQGLRQLRRLGLDGNNLYDVTDSFNDLTSLISLNLAFNNLEEVEDSLYPLKKLRYLNISYNYISELDDDLFKSLNGIEVLDISGNYLSNACSSIRPLQSLTELSMSNMNLDVLDYDCFKGMRNLQRLDLSKNRLVSADSITGHSLPNLMFLHLQNNLLHSFRHGLKNLKQLYELDISENNLSNIKAHHLTHNTQLRILKVEGNPWDCSEHLLDVFRNLATRMVQLVGAPLCYLDGL